MEKKNAYNFFLCLYLVDMCMSLKLSISITIQMIMVIWSEAKCLWKLAEIEIYFWQNYVAKNQQLNSLKFVPSNLNGRKISTLFTYRTKVVKNLKHLFHIRFVFLYNKSFYNKNFSKNSFIFYWIGTQFLYILNCEANKKNNNTYEWCSSSWKYTEFHLIEM